MSENEISLEHCELSVDEAPVKWRLKTNDLADHGRSGTLVATRQELVALTDLLNDEHDLEVTAFRCFYEITPRKFSAPKSSGLKYIEGCHGSFQLIAELKQTCVVTLERIDTLVEEEFSQDFTGGGSVRPEFEAAGFVFDDPFCEERPLKLNKGVIELGSLAYQYFSMAIDPNPRKAGVCFEEKEAAEDKVLAKPPSPFVVLKDYKHKK